MLSPSQCNTSSISYLPSFFIQKSMVLKDYGLTEKLIAKPILGVSDAETVKLDFDKTAFKTVKYWSERTMKWFRLNGFIILKSSEKCYHVLFKRPVSWSENVRIVAWIAPQARNQGLVEWFLMQCIKRSSTLRISPKQVEPSP